MKLSMKTQDLKHKVEVALNKDKTAQQKVIDAVEQKNVKIKEYNVRAEKSAKGYTEEELDNIFKSHLQEEVRSYLKKGLFFNKEESYITRKPTFYDGKKEIDGEGYVFITSENYPDGRGARGLVYLREYCYTSSYVDTKGSVRKRNRRLYMGYSVVPLKSVPCYTPDPHLLRLRDNVLLAEKSGIDEVILEENDLDILRCFSEE